jgi:F-type H+-transporting ATPase subunit epsilon
MMSQEPSIPVRIISPAKLLLEKTVSQIQVPGVNGYIGLLAGHVDFITQMTVGTLALDTAEGTLFFFVTGGYVEYHQDHVQILVDFLERPEDIDVERAKKAESRALSRLLQLKEAPVEVGRVLASLERAKARQKLAALKK